MAGDVDAEDLEGSKVCKYCQKTIVNAIAKCINCKGVYHTSCVLRIAGLVAVGKQNQVKCCLSESEVISEKLMSKSVKKILSAKNEIIQGKNEVITELRAKEDLMYKNLTLMEEKIENLHKKLQKKTCS